MKSNYPIVTEEWVFHASSKRRVLLDITKKAMHDHKGKILGVLAIGHDVTKRKEELDELEKLNKLAKSLTDSQASLLSLFDKGDSVLYKWENDFNLDVAYVSTSVIRLVGYSKEEFLSKKVNYTDCIHPDDIKNVIKELKNAIKNDLDYFKHKPYRVIHKNGDIKWILDYGTVK